MSRGGASDVPGRAGEPGLGEEPPERAQLGIEVWQVFLGVELELEGQPVEGQPGSEAPCCVTSFKLINPSVPWFSHL